eukprot:630654-Rhodomonas_salina.1
MPVPPARPGPRASGRGQQFIMMSSGCCPGAQATTSSTRHYRSASDSESCNRFKVKLITGDLRCFCPLQPQAAEPEAEAPIGKLPPGPEPTKVGL